MARAALAVARAVVLAACGGSKDAESGSSNPMPASRSEAARFLTQATFGPTDAEVDRVMSLATAAGSTSSSLPTTSVDPLGATLGKWFGLSDSQRLDVFPNLQNFGTRDLGFMV